jgi:hypothetical protein
MGSPPHDNLAARAEYCEHALDSFRRGRRHWHPSGSLDAALLADKHLRLRPLRGLRPAPVPARQWERRGLLVPRQLRKSRSRLNPTPDEAPGQQRPVLFDTSSDLVPADWHDHNGQGHVHKWRIRSQRVRPLWRHHRPLRTRCPFSWLCGGDAAWGVRCLRVPCGGKRRPMARKPLHLSVRWRTRPMRRSSTAHSRRSIRARVTGDHWPCCARPARGTRGKRGPQRPAVRSGCGPEAGQQRLPSRTSSSSPQRSTLPARGRPRHVRADDDVAPRQTWRP